jgi:hypothetical protein
MSQGVYQALVSVPTLISNAGAFTALLDRPQVFFIDLCETLSHLLAGLRELPNHGISHDKILAGLCDLLAFLKDVSSHRAHLFDPSTAERCLELLYFYRYSVKLLTACIRSIPQAMNPGFAVQGLVRSEIESVWAYLSCFFKGIQPITDQRPSDAEIRRIDQRTRAIGESIKLKLEIVSNDPSHLTSKGHGEIVWGTRHAIYWLSKVPPTKGICAEAIVADTCRNLG